MALASLPSLIAAASFGAFIASMWPTVRHLVASERRKKRYRAEGIDDVLRIAQARRTGTWRSRSFARQLSRRDAAFFVEALIGAAFLIADAFPEDDPVRWAMVRERLQADIEAGSDRE